MHMVDCRGGDGEWAVQELVRICSRPLPEVHGVQPTELFSRNAAVDAVNRDRLAGLPHSPVSPLLHHQAHVKQGNACVRPMCVRACSAKSGQTQPWAGATRHCEM